MIIVVGCFAVLDGPLQVYTFMKDVLGMNIDPASIFVSLAVFLAILTSASMSYIVLENMNKF